MSNSTYQAKLQLTLSVPQLNQILETLGGQSYHSVYELIETIQQQCSAQLSKAQLNTHAQSNVDAEAAVEA